MAEADLDTLIRSIAKKQIKALTVAAKARHGRLMGMAAKAKDKDAKARYRHLAKSTLEHAERRRAAAADHGGEHRRRLQARDGEGRRGGAGHQACEESRREKAANKT